VDNSFSSYQQGPAAQQDSLKETFETESTSYYDNMQVTIYLSFIAFTYPLGILLEMAFAIKSKRVFTLIKLDNILDLAICIVFAIRVDKEYSQYRDGIEGKTEQQVGTTYYNNIFTEADDGDLLSYLYCIRAGCLWIKILILFRLTKFLGPLYKMIQKMAFDILIFMVLFAIQLFIFA
jgi:hypothetical protein